MENYKKILIRLGIIEEKQQKLYLKFATEQIKNWSNQPFLDDSNYMTELFKRAILKYKNLKRATN